jgi:hypothetical protein
MVSRVMPVPPVSRRSSRAAIDQRRLAALRPTTATRIRRLALLVGFGFVVFGRNRGVLGQRRADRVIEIRQAFAVLGRDRDRIAKAEFVGFDRAGAGTRLRFVGDDDHRFAGAAHQGGELPVDRGEARAHIHHEQDRVGALDCGLRLLHHAGDQAVGRPLVETRGIDRRECQVAEPAMTFAPVARHAGPVVDQREALADQPVEQRRVADIRPSDDREGKAHEEINRSSRGCCAASYNASFAE